MKNKRNLIIFIVVALGSGWLGVFVDSVLTEQPEGNSLGMGLWLVLPLISSVILRIINHDWKDGGLKPHFKNNWKWYLVAILIYPLAMLLSVFMANIFSMVEMKPLTFSAYLSVVMVSVPGNIAKNIFEEFAWRGYLTPKLVALKLNDWIIYLITGTVWSLWHAAYYLVFLPDTYLIQTQRVSMLISGCIIMTCWSIMFVEIRRLTNSVWPCLIMHTIEDAVPTVLVTIGGYFVFSQNKIIWFDPITGVVANLFFIAVGLMLRHNRRKRERNISTASQLMP